MPYIHAIAMVAENIFHASASSSSSPSPGSLSAASSASALSSSAASLRTVKDNLESAYPSPAAPPTTAWAGDHLPLYHHHRPPSPPLSASIDSSDDRLLDVDEVWSSTLDGTLTPPTISDPPVHDDNHHHHHHSKPSPPLKTSSSSSSHPLFPTLLDMVSRVKVSMLAITPPSQPLEFYNIHSSDTVTMCIFVLRAGHSMPIHTHPNMTVVSKVIHGRLHVRTYELLDDTLDDDYDDNGDADTSGQQQRHRRRRARVAFSGTVGPDDKPLIIFPDHGPSVHSLHAAHGDVVILDIIGPPYSDPDRPCTVFVEEEHRDDGFIDDDEDTVTLTQAPESDSGDDDATERLYRGQPVLAHELDLVRGRRPQDVSRWAHNVIDAFERIASRSTTVTRSWASTIASARYHPY